MKLPAAIIVAALAIRLAYVLVTPGYMLRDDALDYDRHAVSIVQHHRFATAYGRPTAFRPPAYPVFLAGVYKITGVAGKPVATRVHVARIANAFVSLGIVILIGLLAFQLWGRIPALVAMALAAVYVPLILVGAAVMSEPLYTLVELGALIAAVQHRRSAHRFAWALLAGVLCGVAILGRANGLVLLLPLGFAVWDKRPRWTLSALAPPAVLCIVAALVVAPWSIRNERVLHQFVPFSTQLGSALAGTYNDQAREDQRDPASWRSLKRVPEYHVLWSHIRQSNEAVMEKQLRHGAIDYIKAHPTYVGTVAYWTTRRMLDLAGIHWSMHTATTISVVPGWALAGVICFWIFAVLAVIGAFTRRARETPWFVWAVPLLMYLSVVFLVVETPRYRTAIDPFIVLLAALAVLRLPRFRGR